MLFNSWQFAVFLPIVFCIYWLLPKKIRWAWLLAMSYFFYMCWNVKYVLLILFTTVVSYTCARFLEDSQRKSKQKILLMTAAVASLGVLFFFKYFNFVSGSIESMIHILPHGRGVHLTTLQLLLPVGISFYTFQTLSYVIDVYRGDMKAEHHFGYYALYVSFFPQLVAGPIERATNLLPQIKDKRPFVYEQATYGLKLMVWGLFKKLLVADMLAQYVDRVFDDVYSYSGLAIVIAAVFFALQIYCDFSGYSDMAIGTAKLFGIDIMTNFRAPYFSKSIKEFWSRWHISLSTWFRDYVYIPMGGNRTNKIGQARNLIVTFLLSGLWHGADWTYIMWGGLHGVMQALERFLLPRMNDAQNKIGKVLQSIIAVLLVDTLVVLAWIFFRANTLEEAVYLIRNIFVGILNPVSYIKSGYIALEITARKLTTLLIPILVLMGFDLISLKMDVILWVSKQKLLIRWFIYFIFVEFILIYVNFCMGNAELAQKFIYFDF